MDMSRIVATSDVVFKYLFGAKSSTELLRRFVNAVQRHAGMEEFPSLEIVNPIGEREFASAKQTVIDIKAKSADGTVVNVEVQVRSQAEYGERSLYYWAQSYTEQIAEGDKYTKLKPVVSVSLVNFGLFPEPIPYHSTYRLLEVHHPDYCLTDDCVMHYLELKKLPEDDSSELAQWLYALKHLDEKEGPMIVLLKQNETLRELAERYYRFEGDSEARMIYNARLKEQRDQMAWMDEAEAKGLEQGLQKGIQEGLQRGIQEGLQKGIHQGIERGRDEGEKAKAREVAHRLRERGFSAAEVAEITGLSPSDL